MTDSLRKHVKVTHNENVTMTCCKFCDKVFMDTSQKAGHMASMHSDIAKTGSTGGNSSQTGNDCNSTLNTSIHDNAGAGDNFKVVKKEKHDKYYQCPRCTKSFSNQDTLTKHGRFFHNISGTYIINFKSCLLLTSLTKEIDYEKSHLCFII